MRKISKFFFTALIALVFTLSACNKISSGIPFLIDNPTKAAIKISVDGKTIDIAAMMGQELTLKSGVHTLQSPLTGLIEFVVYDLQGGKGALINPSLETYVLVQEIYAVDENAAKHFGPIQSKITLDGVEFSGYVQTRKGLFIDRTWHYDVHEDFPEKITVYGDQTGNIPDKLFNKTDFIKYYETNYGEPGSYAKNNRPDARPAMTVETYPALPRFEDSKMEAAAKDIKALYSRYLNTNDAAALDKIRKEYFDVQMRFTKDYVNIGSDLKAGDQEAYSALVVQVSNLLSKNVRVLPKRH
jgi:hypothetical protein